MEKVISINDLKQKNRYVFKKGTKQIALFFYNQEIFAIDNRCPHEGYPLVQGNTNDSCILTCNWHNWKFNLKDGKCLTGGDNVKTYKTEIKDDFIYIDLSEPTKEEIEKEINIGLSQAFKDRQYARISRELARFYFNELDLLTPIRKAILWSYDKLEDGTNHAYAACADWLSLYFESGNVEDKISYLTESIDYIALESLREKDYSFTQNSREWDYKCFVEAVEIEDENLAIEYINGAFFQGLHFKDIEKALVEVALEHYNDFGHSLIYVQKTGYLIERLGYQVEKVLTLALVRSIIKATREDLIPDFKEYNNCLNSKGSKTDKENIFLLNTNKSMSLTLDLLEDRSIKEVYEIILKSLAKNLLYFDINYQNSYTNKVSDNIGWLDFTHALTFSNASNELCNKYPEFWKKALLQMSCFNGRNIDYLDLDINTKIYEVSNFELFKNQVIEKLGDHGIPTPIFPTHLLKTSLAVFDEFNKTPDIELKNLLLSSLNRFLNSPIKQKHIKRTIKQSIELVSRDFR